MKRIFSNLVSAVPVNGNSLFYLIEFYFEWDKIGNGIYSPRQPAAIGFDNDAVYFFLPIDKRFGLG
jgi:hypothetical protein